jgi:hypothetical protein
MFFHSFLSLQLLGHHSFIFYFGLEKKNSIRHMAFQYCVDKEQNRGMVVEDMKRKISEKQTVLPQIQKSQNQL